MYYRVAIQYPADPLDRPANWQWKSTVLSSLQTLFQVLQLYGAVGEDLDHLWVFSCSSREALDEPLLQENLGLEFLSETAAHVLQERLLPSPEEPQATPERNEGANRRWQPSLMGAIAARSRSSVKENGLLGRGRRALESRRLELECGPGGDHDVPYHFVLPPSRSQVLAWTRLLASRACGEWQR